MHIHLLRSLDELSRYAEEWDRLAGVEPFRSWTWLSHWWRCYGSNNDCRQTKQLAVMLVFDETDVLVGIAPFYLEHSIAFGRVLRMLGDGAVCSDYIGMLCQSGMEESVVETIAHYLLECLSEINIDGLQWDLIELQGVDYEDYAVNRLAEHLSAHSCRVHRRSNINCWRIELPGTWEEYLKMLSKNHRCDVRRLKKQFFDTRRAVLHTVEQIGELPSALDGLIDMHQRRRRSLGEPGCFASPTYESFIRGVLPDLMRKGNLHFIWLEIDGRPVATEYHLTGGGMLYTYQTGVDPDALKLQPGNLMNIAAIHQAIEYGYRIFDFLRGDEPYKAHFRAKPRPSMEIRIVPNRASTLLRHKLWLAGRKVKRLIKSLS